MKAVLLPDSPDSYSKVVGSMASTDWLTVWEGAVRSGKTVYALCAFSLYIVRSVETEFLLSGRTVGTIERNAIFGDYGLLSLIPRSQYRKVGESRAVVFSVGGARKTVYVFGAADIRAYMAIRGNSYGGWFADEVNMHDKEFVSEALRRTAVSKDRRHFWTLNPDNPRHWIYADYLDRYEAMSEAERDDLGGFSLWHFVPLDNPAMSEQAYRSLCVQYPRGYLYDRYVLGLRCVAEGLIYPSVADEHFRPVDPKDVTGWRCALDFGADHPTVAVIGGKFKGNAKDWRIVAEYYDKGSDKTTYDHYCGLMDLMNRLGLEPHKVPIAVDPAAKTMRLELASHGLQAVKARNDVLPGIAYVRTAVARGILSFNTKDKLPRIRGEFATYSWDAKASERGEDKPVKVGDDAMDALRYFAYTWVRPEAGGFE